MAEKHDDESLDALISAVSLQDVIFNKKNKNHHRTQCVEAAWMEIATLLNKDEKWCSDKWKNLYRNYRNFLDKENLPSGSGATNRGRPKFAYAQQMAFLSEHIQPKKTKSNFISKAESPEHFTGNDSSEPYAGGTQSSKSFHGLSQQTTGVDEAESSGSIVEMPNDEPSDVDQIYRELMNETPPNVPIIEEPIAHCSYALPKRPVIPSEFEKGPPNRKKIKLNQPNLDSENSSENEKSPDNITNKPKPRSKIAKPRAKTVKKRTNKRDRSSGSSPENGDLADNFYRRMTDAAGSITQRFQKQHNKQNNSNQDGIISGFCKMQKHMLHIINEDSRLEYMRECTEKLTELCTREKHIM